MMSDKEIDARMKAMRDRNEKDELSNDYDKVGPGKIRVSDNGKEVWKKLNDRYGSAAEGARELRKTIPYNTVEEYLDYKDNVEPQEKHKRDIDFVISQFPNGRERYQKHAIFNKVVNSLVNNPNSHYELFDQLIEMLDKQQEHINKLAMYARPEPFVIPKG